MRSPQSGVPPSITNVWITPQRSKSSLRGSNRRTHKIYNQTSISSQTFEVEINPASGSFNADL